eukprot:1147566-Pelagomonas_calceolata.AAC.2
MFRDLSSGWPLCTGCLNRSAPARDQVWDVVQNCAYSCGPHAFPGCSAERFQVPVGARHKPRN